MRKALVAVLMPLALTASLAACTSDGGVDVGPPDVAVDTSDLREIKADIGMADCAPGSGEAVDGGLPELTLQCLGGGPDVELSSLRGPMVINLWASWCDPCREEMPALEEFHQQYGDRVAILGMDVNDIYPERALALAADTGATYPSLVDVGGEIFAEDVFAFARRGLPGFVFVDEQGLVVGSASGGVESVDQIVDLVDEHLGIAL